MFCVGCFTPHDFVIIIFILQLKVYAIIGLWINQIISSSRESSADLQFGECVNPHFQSVRRQLLYTVRDGEKVVHVTSESSKCGPKTLCGKTQRKKLLLVFLIFYFLTKHLHEVLDQEVN